jgi:ribosomal protein S12 methylthiotransferase accessory factor
VASRKTWLKGTHRAAAPAETLARFGRHARALGITRLADLTGLDYLGIPVFMATRPNARSLSVAQGKGLDASAARVSAFMEAAELDHAERIARRPVVASYAALKKRAQVVDPFRLPRLRGASFAMGRRIAWLDGVELNSNVRVFVPLELVDADFTVGRGALSGTFLRSTNGLASGNHYLEAVCAGLCEAIERDATFLWALRSNGEQADRRLDLESIDDPDCRAMIATLSKRGMAVAVWDMTTEDIGAASFICRIAEAPGNARSRFGSFFGFGCHLARGIALSRAVTEAVQSRLTAIAGARDDLTPDDYHVPDTEDLLIALAFDVQEKSRATRRFRDVPNRVNGDFESDLQDLLTGLRIAGLEQVIVVDLTRPGIGIPVVRVVVPGLEVATTRNLCAPGRRAGAFRKARR